jgi:hypothetical protein
MLSLTAVSGVCQEVTVGVVVGDSFMYEYHITVDGDISFYTPFDDYSEYIYDFFQTWNTTDWELREVTAVSGTVITFNVTTCYINGTVTNELVDFNLTSNHDFWAVGAELDVGAYVGNSSLGDDVYIDELIQWTYEEETRDTNTVHWIGWLGVERALWWDKQTGVLVKEWNKYHVEVIGYPEQFVTIHAWHILTDTNRWEIPEHPTTMLLMLVLVTATITVYKQKTKKSMKQRLRMV